ncbi:MAG: peptide ABC transporter substrate-binding protein, partial [Simkaniaceae bacterium]|nr:peptide ABC transporter substrate-binding protein [Simkaniaceae bacterium]
AESYEVTDDKKTYTFKLCESYWSNGAPVVAYDFEYAWKKVLSPGFASPFAYVFYPIKNGKKAKEGKISIDEVGIESVEERTLKVELENPAPYFIELTANTLYSPVNHEVDQKHPNWSKQKNESFVCNGPFTQIEPGQGYFYNFIKNETYVNEKNVKFNQILTIRIETKHAIEMFNKNQIHCMGSNLLLPLTQDRMNLEDVNITQYLSPKTFWQCFNVNHFPFNNRKIRRAFSHAISRKEVIANHPSQRVPAQTPLPYQLTLCNDSNFLIDENQEKAKELFTEALEEINVKIEDFPVIYISVVKQEKDSAETLKNQFEKVLGIKCEVESSEWNRHFDKLTSRRYQIGLIHWTSWVNDPIYTLQSFKHGKEKVNFTGWENKDFQKLLDQSDRTIDIDQRNQFLYSAEKLVINEAIITPICYCVDYLIKCPSLMLSRSSSHGTVDFSQAYFSQDKKSE